VITIRLDLSDGARRELEVRVRDGGYPTIEDYVRELIETDLADDEAGWEMTPELAAALRQGAEESRAAHDFASLMARAKARLRGA
jgi:Arc/MetJ-type ribon-helix-helix transcriptional regulator